MLHSLSIWLLVVAFSGAGVVNALGMAGTQTSFVSWGFPPWWGRLTGGLEVAVAGLIAFAPTRGAGLLLGALIIAAAIATVLRHRAFPHLAPLGVFAALLASSALSS